MWCEATTGWHRERFGQASHRCDRLSANSAGAWVRWSPGVSRLAGSHGRADEPLLGTKGVSGAQQHLRPAGIAYGVGDRVGAGQASAVVAPTTTAAHRSAPGHAATA